MNPAALQEADALAAEVARRQAKQDPVAFARLTKLEPDPWQQEVLSSRSKRILLNCSRQSGKSTTLSTIALHTAIYQPKSLTLVFCPAERQSKELMLKVQERLAWLPIKPKLEGEAKTELAFGNGSRIISLPATESTVRSYTADLLIEDEAGDVPDTLYNAILPMVVIRRGRIILSGTPKGRQGHYFREWEDKRGNWERYEIDATKCPRLSAEELEDQKRKLLDRFEQEYFCKFINAGSGMVYGGFDDMTNCMDSLPKPKDKQEWSYMLGLDFGFNDDCAFVLLGYLPQDPCAYVVLSFKETQVTPSICGEKVAELQSTFKFSRIIGDTSGLGKGYAEEMRRRFHVPVEPAEKQNKRGYIDLINGEFKSGGIKILRPANAALIDEMQNLPWHEDRIKEHPGFPNHLCDAFLYVWRACTTYLQKLPDDKKMTPEERIEREMKEYFKKQDERNELAWAEQKQSEEEMFGMVYSKDEID